MRGLALILLVSLPSALTGAAHAQTSRGVTAELSVQAEPAQAAAIREAGCDDRLKLERRVARILGRAAPSPGRNGSLFIAVRFRRNGGELLAEVTATGPKPGRRELRDVGPSCEALNEGVAVAIALILDSAEPLTPEPHEAAPQAPPAAPPAETPATLSTPSAPPRSRAWQARASLAAAGSYGLGGTASWLGLGRVGVRAGHLLLDLGMVASLPARESFDGGQVRTSLWFGSARGCYLVGRGPALGPCAQLAVGRLSGEGESYGETRAAHLPWAAVSLGLGAELPLGAGVAATFEGSLCLPLERHTFSVENRGIAWESKRLAGLLAAGVSLPLF